MSLPREGLVRALEEAVATEARSLLGAERNITPTFDELTGRVRLFQKLTIVAAVERPGTQVSLDDARHLDLDAQVDGDITVELPYERGQTWPSLLHLPEEWAGFHRRAAQVAKEIVLRHVR